MSAVDDQLTPPPISAPARLRARELLVAHLAGHPDDAAAMHALEAVDASLDMSWEQLEMPLPVDHDPVAEWPLSFTGALLAERLLVDRLHTSPADHAATRALTSVSYTLAGTCGHAAFLRPDRLTCLEKDHRTMRARLGAFAASAAAALCALILRIVAHARKATSAGVRAAHRLPVIFVRARATVAARAGRAIRPWLSLDGLRRVGRRSRAFARGTIPSVVAVSFGCITAAVCLAMVLTSSELLGRMSLVSAKVEFRPLAKASKVYAADGSQLGLLGVQDREPVSYSAVPRVLVDAVVATEDSTFWTNPGIDVGGLARAFVANIDAGHVVQGGSTITEQLAKNRLLNPKRDAGRKAEQVALSLAITADTSKRKIMSEYLNTVYFGRGAYGVQAAARRYFRPNDLVGSAGASALRAISLPEAALLAGLIANPSTYDPFAHPDQARARRHEVLTRMARQHMITSAQVAAADAAPLPRVAPPPDLRPFDIVVDQVQQNLLADPRLGASTTERRQRLLQGGLRVYTTIDPTAQAQARAAIHGVLPNDPRYTAALASIDPATGDVVAMVNGPGYQQLQYNLVTHPPGRQPGSTYKVITLAAALEAGYSPNDVLDGSSPCLAQRPGYPPWVTANAEPGGGSLSLRDATADSVNCAYAHLIASLGPPAVVDMAHRLGITQPVPNYLPITLGASEATPLEMATVASTLSAGGVRHDPVLITRVVAPDGTVLIDNTHPQGRRVLAPDIAACETDVLRDVIGNGTGTAAQLDNIDAAGKTGTTDDHGDAWFLGYTSNLATVVWMGAPTARLPMNDVGGIEVFGGTYPAQIWHAFMTARLGHQTVANLPSPSPVCDRPGAYVSDDGRDGVVPTEPVIQQSAPPTTAAPSRPSANAPAPTPSTTPPTTPPTTPLPTTTPPTTAPPPPTTTLPPVPGGLPGVKSTNLGQ